MSGISRKLPFFDQGFKAVNFYKVLGASKFSGHKSDCTYYLAYVYDLVPLESSLMFEEYACICADAHILFFKCRLSQCWMKWKYLRKRYTFL